MECRIPGLSLSKQGYGKVVVRPGILGVDAQRLVVIKNRLIDVPLACESSCEIIIGLCIVRCELQFPFVMLNSLIQLSLLFQGHTYVVMGPGIVRDNKCGVSAIRR